MDNNEYHCKYCGPDICSKCEEKWDNDHPPCDVIDFFSYKYNHVIVYIYKHDDKVA